MRQKFRTTPLWLIACLGVSGCAGSGSFCDLYEPILFDPSLARAIVREDRAEAIKIDTMNGAYARLRCAGPV